MALNQPTVLDITKRPDGYRFVLARPGEPFMATRNVLDALVTHSTVRQLCGLIGRRIDEQNAGTASPFGPNCRALLDELLSEVADPRIRQLREALRNMDSPLLIQTDDADVYWELLKDGDSEDAYLAMRLDVGRSLKTQAVPPAVPRTDANLRCLLVANPNGDEPDWALPETEREAIDLRVWLQTRGVDCADFLSGAAANEGSLLDKLAHHRYDIIHYAGHVVLDPLSKQYALRLHGGLLFPASSIRKQVKGAPMVFLNACWSSKALGAATNVAGSVEGMTNAFLEAGAQLVVGALFEIPDIGARKFAEKFYEGVLASRPIGEAMRLARHHVLNKSGCGAAWASFVLYGDPCLKIEFRVDRLSRALQATGLSRDDFETACIRLVEQAFDYGRGNGGVSTAHLLAAMVGGEDDHLRAALDGKGVHPRRLLDAFKDLFKVLGTAAEEAATISFSPNVARILDMARNVAHSESRAKVKESDLVKAFAQHGGGSAGEVLKSMGVDVAALAPRLPAPPPPTRDAAVLVDHVGLLRRAHCTETAWQVLADAVQLATQRGDERLSSGHLMLGLFKGHHDPVIKALRRLGLDGVAVAKGLGVGPPSAGRPIANTGVPEILCSANTALVLAAAATESARTQRRVDIRDLLGALIHSRDSAASRFLREHLGLFPESLECSLFGDTGALLDNQVEPAMLRVLHQAAECAREKRHPALSRTHLLHAMLSNPEGAFAALVRESGMEPAVLADQLYVGLMPAGEATDSAVDTSLRSFSAGALRLLRASEFEAQAQGAARVAMAHLVKAILIDGCGSSGQFLIAHGLNWGGLRALSEQGPAGSRQLH